MALSRAGVVWLSALLLGASSLVGAGIWLARKEPVLPELEPKLESRKLVPFEVAISVYDGALQPGWNSWGWGQHTLPKTGPAVVDFSSWGGIVFGHSEVEDSLGAFVFRVRAPEGHGDFLEVFLGGRAAKTPFPTVRLKPSHYADVGGGFREALVPMSELNPGRAPFDSVTLRAFKAVPSAQVLIDAVSFSKPSAAHPSEALAVAVRVECEKATTPIDARIYGIARGVGSSGESGHRVGGNAMTRLNWDAGNLWNAGSDWFFENHAGKDGVWDWIAGARKNGLNLALVVPMIGWVAKDGTSVGFPTSKFGKQQKHDPQRPEAGDGFSPDGKPLDPLPPTHTSVEASPATVEKWIRRVRESDGGQAAQSPHIYILDNEPSLWNTTHRDVHPQPVSYDELLRRTIDYGTAIRRADPEGVLAGPAEWGWSAYFYSAKDLASGWDRRPDRLAHGNVPLVPWYLQRLAAYEKEHGVRLLDLLDLHFYPAAEGVYGDRAATDERTAALRIRSTRALWDPEYRDESWINEHVKLIPRMKDWIAQNYPGRGIMFGEWSFGAHDHVSGALAIAETLGRFGQHGVSAAYYWDTLPEGSAGYYAFRAFRNFDGRGAKFLELSVPTQALPGISLFASTDRAKDNLVLVLLNNEPRTAFHADIDVSRCGAVEPRRVFSYEEGGQGLVERPPAEKPRVRELLPPYSITVIELAKSAAR